MEQAAALGPDRRRAPLGETPQGRALGAHQIGFQHVVGGVAEQEDVGSGFASRIGGKPQAGGAGGGGQAASGLGAGPLQGAESHPQLGAGAFGKIGPGRALRLQAMIHVQDDQVAAGAGAPGPRRQQQGKGIAAAGEGHRDRRRAFARQAAIERLADAGRKGQESAAARLPRSRSLGYLHLASARACLARVATRVEGLG